MTPPLLKTKFYGNPKEKSHRKILQVKRVSINISGFLLPDAVNDKQA